MGPKAPELLIAVITSNMVFPKKAEKNLQGLRDTLPGSRATHGSGPGARLTLSGRLVMFCSRPTPLLGNRHRARSGAGVFPYRTQ